MAIPSGECTGHRPRQKGCVDVKVGVPREVKNHEYRVAITPAGAQLS